MKKVLFAIVGLIGLTACEKKPQNIFDKIEKENLKHRSVYFKAVRQYHYSNQPDTVTTPYEVWIVRDEKDALRGGYVWVDDHYRPYNIIYDRGTMYLAIPPKNMSMKYTDYKEKFISPLDWIDVFLRPDSISYMATKPAVNYRVTDTVYSGNECYKLTIEEGKKQYDWVLDKANLMPLAATATEDRGDFTFYEKMTFSDYEFDKVDLADLKERQKKILAENPVEQGDVFAQLMKEGDEAPVFDGKFFTSGDEFSLTDYLGKNVIILDFWYMHCPPCVRAMPLLSEFYDEYKDKGLKMFGLNSVDNKPAKLARLKIFLDKRKVSYDIVLIESSVDRLYKVRGYPTMYLVGRDGRIASVEIGFSEKRFEEFKAKVAEMLSE